MGSLLSSLLPAAPQGVSKATQTEGDCPVCHSVQSDSTAVPCGHQFCLGCLLRQAASSPTCPRCSNPVLSVRFSVLGRNDFLQCILSPPGVPPGPGSWARRALFRLVYSRPEPSAPQPAPAPAEPPRSSAEAADGFPSELWAELLHGHEHLLDPVRPWLRQSLNAIYGPQWWEARQVESIALSTLCICGPDREGLTHMLQGYLGDYTAPLIHGLLHVTRHRCRDAWLKHRSQAARDQHDPEEQQDESGSARTDPFAWPGRTPALGLAPDSSEDQPGQPVPGHPGDQPQPQPQPWPEQDAAAPGPSVPRRRSRRTRRTQRRRPHRAWRLSKIRRRRPRRK